VGRTTTTTSMSSSRKRKGVAAAAAVMHPRNKYAENAPDFSLLASKYPAFRSFVSYGAGTNNRPRIDWTDFNATRELTRVLLDHDYGIKW
jgi:23S rRNA (adenine1618-N6)-methyltransferase